MSELEHTIVDPDMSPFTVGLKDGVLVVSGELDYETKTSRTIVIRSCKTAPVGNGANPVNPGGAACAKTTLIVYIDDVNEVPTKVTLGGGNVASLSENTKAGTVVGEFETIDPDVGQTFTYALEEDGGGRFMVSADGQRLVVAAGADLDYESLYPNPSLTVKVRSTDSGSPPQSLTTTFTVNVLDVNEAPTAVSLVNGTVSMETGVGTLFGTLSTTDPDTYNAAFRGHIYTATTQDAGVELTAVGNRLMLVRAITPGTHLVQIRSQDDGGLAVGAQVAVTVEGGSGGNFTGGADSINGGGNAPTVDNSGGTSVPGVVPIFNSDAFANGRIALIIAGVRLSGLPFSPAQAQHGIKFQACIAKNLKLPSSSTDRVVLSKFEALLSGGGGGLWEGMAGAGAGGGGRRLVGENTTTGGAATGSSSTMDVEYLVPAREELEARIFFAAASALVGCDACGNELKAFLGQGIAGDEFTGASVEFYVKPRVQMIDEADLAGLTWKPGSAGTGGGSGAAGGGAADGPSMQGGGGGGGGVVTNGGDSMVGMAVGVTVGVALAIVVAVLLFVTRWRSNDRKRRRAESLQNELAANRGLHSTGGGGDGTITNFWEEFAGAVENDGVAMVDQRGSGRGGGRGGGRG